MKVKTFKGLIKHDEVIQLRLSTKQGLVGYKIHKFELIPQDPSGNSGTNICKVFTVPQTTTSSTIEFDNPTLIAACVDPHNASAFQYDPNPTIIVDNVTVNQDLYITHNDPDGNSTSTNFYLELEQVKLDVNEATVATLKDMRGRE
tara:strand:+ start:103 stop:540 length:438 start_codon:yes stop_codon:yes gene_type:complete